MGRLRRQWRSAALAALLLVAAAAAAAATAGLGTTAALGAAAVASGPHASGGVSSRVQSLLAGMTLEQKAGQMLQLDLVGFLNPGSLEVNRTRLEETLRKYHVGSILNGPFTLGPSGGKDGWTATDWKEIVRSIHQAALAQNEVPVLYGIDSIHGANYIYGAVLFPQQINAAASFNRALVKEMGRITAKDTKAGGIPWLFAPVLGINTQPLWSRSFETFGEDPYLVAEMGKAIIQGIQYQAPNSTFPPAAACMKHYVAYPAATTGHDRSPIELASRTVKQYYAPPFRAAVQEAGVKSAMEAYTEVSGVPMASNREYLVDLLREDMGFEGMLVTDYNEIGNLHHFHFVAEDMTEAVRLAMQDTSIDMSMNPPMATGFFESLIHLVKTGVIPESRLDASVARVLALKEWVGLLDDPLHMLDDFPDVEASVGSDEDKAAALALARESIVLLENRLGFLPLLDPAAGKRRPPRKIFVTGRGCHNLGLQTGGWTIHWQGAHRNSVFTQGSTFLEGIQARFNTSEVHYHPGVTIDGDWIPGRDEALRRYAEGADLIVACVGEHTYAEKPGDINDLALPAGQLAYVKSLHELGPPVVTVLVEGRARLLGDATAESAAVLDAMLVGPSGGQALAEILAGDVNPSARLPFTYPSQSGVSPQQYYRKPSSLCTTGRAITPFHYVDCPRAWEFGHGLSYTHFVYSNVTLSAATVDERTPLTVRVTVTNAGRRKGKEAVLLFVTDKVRRVTPEYKLLRRFEKMELAPGEATEVAFTLHPEQDLSYIGIEGRRVLESGLFYLGLGPAVDCRAKPDECHAFTLELSPSYDAACEAACDAWAAAERRSPPPPGRCGAALPTLPAEAQAWAASRPACMGACLAARGTEDAWTMDYADCLEREARRGQCRLTTRCWNPLRSARMAASNGTDDNGGGDADENGDAGAGPEQPTGAPASFHIEVDWQTLLMFFVCTVLAIVGLVLLVVRIGGHLITGEIAAYHSLSQHQHQQHQQHRRSSSDEMQQSVSHHLYVPLQGEEEAGE